MTYESTGLNLNAFAKEELWVLSGLRALLFEEYRPHQNFSKLSKATILQLQQLDRHLTAAEKSGAINIVTYTNTGLARIEEPAFLPQELLKVIKFRGYPVPDGLIEARDKGDWDKAEELLKKFHENMKVYVQCGGKIYKDEFEKLTKADDEKSKPPTKPDANPEGTRDKLTFYHVGKTWRVGFSELKNVPNTKGMLCYQYLLLNPNIRYSGLDVSRLDGVDHKMIITPHTPRDSVATEGDKEDQINSVTLNNGKILSVKRDILEMKSACEKAEEESSPDAKLLRDEYEKALSHYTSNHDKYGKPRDNSAELKAVKAVAKNLKTAKDNILEVLPELAALLKDIKTGNTFGYIPSNPNKPIKIIVIAGE